MSHSRALVDSSVMECDHLCVVFRVCEFPKTRIKSESISKSPRPIL